MNKLIKVLIADDHAIVRIGLASILEIERDITVVGEAQNGLDAVSKAKLLSPDVIIMDLMMPKVNGINATAQIHEMNPNIKIIILTTFSTSDGISTALQKGASGALLKNAAESELPIAIRTVMEGHTHYSADIRRPLKTDPPLQPLTMRQREILQSMCRGLTDKDIARQLDIRVDSVNGHVRDILKKLDAANRTEAVAIALRKQLLKL